MKYEEIRQEIVDTAKAMLAEGLVTMTAGNISVRIPGQDMCAITPSGVAYPTMKPEDVAVVTLDGKVVEGKLKPSSETPMHTLILREMPEVNAVVHTHAPHALAFAVAHRPLPLVCIEGFPAGCLEVLVSEFGIPGTEQIGRNALEALRKQPGSRAVMLANHGLLTVGRTLAEAYTVASKVETQAKVYQLALTIGQPVCFTGQQIKEIFGGFQAK